MLSHETLDVYNCAVTFLGISAELDGKFPEGYGKLAEQLRRASTSISLNIAEASGKTSADETAYHYSVARGSAYECAAIVDALDEIEGIDRERYERAKLLLERIVSMLTKLCAGGR